MVSYKSSVAALVAAASLVAAQNATIIIQPNNGTTGSSPNNGNSGAGTNLNLDISFTINLPGLGPNGLVDVPYLVNQHCPFGGCPTALPQGALPYGIVPMSTMCNVCGPKPTLVTYYGCPSATPVACDSCHTNVIAYTQPPACNTCPGVPTTVTQVYPPTATPAGSCVNCPITYVTPAATPMGNTTVPTPAVYTGSGVSNMVNAAGLLVAGAAIAALL